jgi:abortive infection bacteriophage resistance protein
MNKQAFNKPPLSVSDQVALLKSRGLLVPDEERAARYLQNISYYRLSGYMFPFLTDPAAHKYREGTSFDTILALYRFDRELRLLTFQALEKIEVAVRAQLINQFTVSTNDPFWYIKAVYFASPSQHASLMRSIDDTLKRSTDTFILHFFAAYTDNHPPAWMTFEVLQFGQLSILYSALANVTAKNAIASYFGVKEPVLASWLHTLVYIRNICAHHARLWNRILRIPVKIPKKTDHKWLESCPTDRRMYVVLAILAYLLDIITPENSFRKKMNALFAKYPSINLVSMGFPEDWATEPFWSGKPREMTLEERLKLVAQMKTMTLEEKLDVGAKVAELRKQGKKEESDKLNLTIPLAPHLAKMLKEQIGLDAMLKAGVNVAEAVETFGQGWLAHDR